MHSIKCFTASDVAIIMQNISGIKMMLPNHIKLKPEQRRSMFKLNQKKHVFVESALKFMRTMPDTVPNYVKVSDCNNYLHLYHQYNELICEIDKIKKQMEDVKLQIGNDVMNNTKFAAQSGVKKAEPIYEQLKMNYAVGRNTKKELSIVKV
jgi:hypothetical protein